MGISLELGSPTVGLGLNSWLTTAAERSNKEVDNNITPSIELDTESWKNDMENFWESLKEGLVESGTSGSISSQIIERG